MNLSRKILATVSFWVLLFQLLFENISYAVDDITVSNVLETNLNSDIQSSDTEKINTSWDTQISQQKVSNDTSMQNSSTIPNSWENINSTSESGTNLNIIPGSDIESVNSIETNTGNNIEQPNLSGSTIMDSEKIQNELTWASSNITNWTSFDWLPWMSNTIPFSWINWNLLFTWGITEESKLKLLESTDPKLPENGWIGALSNEEPVDISLEQLSWMKIVDSINTGDKNQMKQFLNWSWVLEKLEKAPEQFSEENIWTLSSNESYLDFEYKEYEFNSNSYKEYNLDLQDSWVTLKSSFLNLYSKGLLDSTWIKWNNWKYWFNWNNYQIQSSYDLSQSWIWRKFKWLSWTDYFELNTTIKIEKFNNIDTSAWVYLVLDNDSSKYLWINFSTQNVNARCSNRIYLDQTWDKWSVIPQYQWYAVRNVNRYVWWPGRWWGRWRLRWWNRGWWNSWRWRWINYYRYPVYYRAIVDQCNSEYSSKMFNNNTSNLLWVDTNIRFRLLSNWKLEVKLSNINWYQETKTFNLGENHFLVETLFKKNQYIKLLYTTKWYSGSSKLTIYDSTILKQKKIPAQAEIFWPDEIMIPVNTTLDTYFYFSWDKNLELRDITPQKPYSYRVRRDSYWNWWLTKYYNWFWTILDSNLKTINLSWYPVFSKTDSIFITLEDLIGRVTQKTTKVIVSDQIVSWPLLAWQKNYNLSVWKLFKWEVSIDADKEIYRYYTSNAPSWLTVNYNSQSSTIEFSWIPDKQINIPIYLYVYDSNWNLWIFSFNIVVQ